MSIDVVGKYCYDLHSPHDERRAPVIVDVVLVGRTKILKIHSALYVQNSTHLRIGFRLHFPSALLARQIMLGPGDVQLPGEQDIRLRPLKPGEGKRSSTVRALARLPVEDNTLCNTRYLGKIYGYTPHVSTASYLATTNTHSLLLLCSDAYVYLCAPASDPAPHPGRYLPVLAALGGTLYLEPRGYMPPEHDVIRLYPLVTDMPSQSGFIASGLPIDATKALYGTSPLYFAAKVRGVGARESGKSRGIILGYV